MYIRDRYIEEETLSKIFIVVGILFFVSLIGLVIHLSNVREDLTVKILDKYYTYYQQIKFDTHWTTTDWECNYNSDTEEYDDC